MFWKSRFRNIVQISVDYTESQAYFSYIESTIAINYNDGIIDHVIT